jgi:hypothetical protein
MAAKRKPQVPRAIPPHYATWSEREAAAERAGAEYVADGDGMGADMHWVIRRRTPGKEVGEWEIVEHCKTVTKSEVDARVAVLNRGTPTRAENQSWGKLTKERTRPGKGVKTSANPMELSVTEWVERLYGDPRSSAVLREYASSERPVSLADLLDLLRSVDETRRRIFTEEMLENISMQLYRKFNIHRAAHDRGGRS